MLQYKMNDWPFVLVTDELWKFSLCPATVRYAVEQHVFWLRISWKEGIHMINLILKFWNLYFRNTLSFCLWWMTVSSEWLHELTEHIQLGYWKLSCYSLGFITWPESLCGYALNPRPHIVNYFLYVYIIHIYIKYQY
jgi:hypothetical protein